MGRIFKRAGGAQFANPYNFPLTISMAEPTAKAVGHIWVKSDAGSQISNVVIDDAFRESYPNGTLLLKESAKDEDYSLSCTKKDTNGVTRTFSYNRPCTDNTLNWAVGNLNKSNALCTIKHLYPLIYAKLNNAIDIENAYVWTGTAWEILCQNGSLLVSTAYGGSAAYFSTRIRTFSISGDSFIYSPETQIPFPDGYVTNALFSPDGKYLLIKNVQEGTKTMLSGWYVYKRSGLTFTLLPNFFSDVLEISGVVESMNLYGISFSHDGKKIAMVSDATNGKYLITCEVLNDKVTNVAYKTSGEVLAYLNLGGMAQYYTFETHPTAKLSWSYDDKYIALPIHYNFNNYTGDVGCYAKVIRASNLLALSGSPTFCNLNDDYSRPNFIPGTYDIISPFYDASGIGFKMATISSDETLSDVTITIDKSIVSSPGLSSGEFCSVSNDGRFILSCAFNANASYQMVSRLHKTGSTTYTITPITNPYLSNVNAAFFYPNSAKAVMIKSDNANKIYDLTDTSAIENTSIESTINNSHMFINTELNGISYFNWNGVTM